MVNQEKEALLGKDLIGKTREEAVQTLESISSQKVKYRILQHGEFAVTMDYGQ